MPRPAANRRWSSLMTTAETFAALHARAFEGQGRAWSATEIRDLLDNPHVFATVADQGFAVTRVIADEAELLTIATDPAARRQGVARDLLSRLEDEARTRGALRLILEVADDNVPARALYYLAGYSELAQRTNYYEKPDGTRTDALILQKQL